MSLDKLFYQSTLIIIVDMHTKWYIFEIRIITDQMEFYYFIDRVIFRLHLKQKKKRIFILKCHKYDQ